MLQKRLSTFERDWVFRVRSRFYIVCVLAVAALACVHIMISVNSRPEKPFWEQASASNSGSGQQPFSAGSQIAKAETDGKVPLIVMSTGGGLWNTGVWSGYNGQDVTRLAWANEGVVVDKRGCKSKCRISQNQNDIPNADAVVMEIVNHNKFLGQQSKAIPFPFPPIRSNDPKVPLFVSFYFEPSRSYPETLDENFMTQFDITMGPSLTSTIPLSMMCPWGRSNDEYLKMPDFNQKSKFAVFFNEHGVAPQYRRFIEGLMSALGEDVDAFQTLKNRNRMPDEAKYPPTRIDFISKYKFVLVVESVVEEDWVEAELSHALISGAVPLYLGASNVIEFMPANTAYVNLHDWLSRSPSSLVSFLKGVAEDRTAYMRFFEWKKQPLSQSFQTKLDQCVFYAECRLCEEVGRLVK